MTADPENILRQAFEAQAAQVRVAPDALGSIRSRVAARRTRRRRTMTTTFASLATGAVATVTAVTVGLTSCLPPEAVPPAGPVTGAGTTGAAPSTAATRVNVRVPVYFAADVDQRIRLYRELHDTTAAADTLPGRIEAALTVMISGRTLDPDYDTLWPAGARVTSVNLIGDVAVVDLAGAVRHSVGAEAARIAIQQLIWTTTAVTAERGTQLRGVRLLFNSEARTQVWGHVDTSGVLTRADHTQTLAPVWLISPQHGDTVGTNVRVQLAGSVPEATVLLHARDSHGEIIRSTVVTLSIGGPGRGEAIVTLSLAPGRYVLEAFYESLEDGSVRGLDDHEITVR